ncbi:MAG: hypothetical protein U0835_02805 [Isosphaeraceae bacterium]
MRWNVQIPGWLAAGALALTVALPGCGSGDGIDRQAISGAVKFEGKPLDKGRIQFFPATPSEVAVPSGAEIVGGSYSIPKSDGLPPGTYKVMISAEGAPPSKGKAKAEEVGDMPGLGPLNAEELIPTKYNSQSTLTAKVEAGGANKFDFDLTK